MKFDATAIVLRFSAFFKGFRDEIGPFVLPQASLRPIDSAKEFGIPKRVIETGGETDNAALRARRSAHESRQCARSARERGRAGAG
jgi:hypothetical protein